jgi:hypothetical protein
MNHNVDGERWAALGLGLYYGAIDLSRTAEDWIVAGIELRDRVARGT